MSTEEKKKSQNVHAGHRERMRKRFIDNGITVFDDYQALEFLMFYVHKRKDTNEIGHALINRFKTLERVFDASYRDLLNVEGIGEAGAILINFIGQLRNKIALDSLETKRIKFDNTAIISQFCMEALKNLNHERLILLCLNPSRELLSMDIISEGVANATVVNTRKILEIVLRYNASGVVLAHNHPGGNSHPSDNDIKMTNSLIDLLASMNIALLDHIICGEYDFKSMAESGLLKAPREV